MKEFFKKFIYSKRFIAFFLSLIIFVILLLSTTYSPVEIATGLTLLCAVYIGGQTIRASNQHKEEV